MAKIKIATTFDDHFEKIDKTIVGTSKCDDKNNIALSYFKRYFRTNEDYVDFTNAHYVVVDDWYEGCYAWTDHVIDYRGQSRVLVFDDNCSRETRDKRYSYQVESNLLMQKLNYKLAPAMVMHCFDRIDMIGTTDRQHLKVWFATTRDEFIEKIYPDRHGNYEPIINWIPRY